MPHCVKGKKCGRACISRDNTCHKHRKRRYNPYRGLEGPIPITPKGTGVSGGGSLPDSDFPNFHSVDVDSSAEVSAMSWSGGGELNRPKQD